MDITADRHIKIVTSFSLWHHGSIWLDRNLSQAISGGFLEGWTIDGRAVSGFGVQLCARLAVPSRAGKQADMF